MKWKFAKHCLKDALNILKRREGSEQAPVFYISMTGIAVVNTAALFSNSKADPMHKRCVQYSDAESRPSSFDCQRAV